MITLTKTLRIAAITTLVGSLLLAANAAGAAETKTVNPVGSIVDLAGEIVTIIFIYR